MNWFVVMYWGQMIKRNLDSQNRLGQITLSAEKRNRVERNTDARQMFLVRGGKAVQGCLLFSR